MLFHGTGICGPPGMPVTTMPAIRQTSTTAATSPLSSGFARGRLTASAPNSVSQMLPKLGVSAEDGGTGFAGCELPGCEITGDGDEVGLGEAAGVGRRG